MAYPFRGNINGSVYSISNDALPMIINNFLLVNKTGGTITANVYLIGSTQISIMPLNKQLSSGEVYENDRPTVLLATELIRVMSSGSMDYDFMIYNMPIVDDNTTST